MLVKDVKLELDRFEFGCLMGALSAANMRDRLPVSLRLKLDIELVKSYLHHPELGQQAEKELKEYEEELAKLESES